MTESITSHWFNMRPVRNKEGTSLLIQKVILERFIYIRNEMLMNGLLIMGGFYFASNSKNDFDLVFSTFCTVVGGIAICKNCYDWGIRWRLLR